MAQPERIHVVKKGSFAVSRLRQVDASSQSDPATAAALGLSFDTGDDTLIGGIPAWNIMNNAGKLSGSPWPDAWVQGNIEPSTLPISFTELKPHELNWILAFLFSDADTAVQIGSGSGYVHKSRWQADSQTRGYFLSICNRLGPEVSGVMKMLLYGCAVESIDLEIDRGADFATLSASVTVPGKYKTNVFRDRILGNVQSTSTTLNSKAVEGTTAQTRLDSILGIVADIESDGTSRERLIASVASDATPAVITHAAPNVNFKKVMTNIDGQYVDRGNGATNFVIAMGDDSDEVLLGSYKQINHILYTASVVNAEAQTLSGVYYTKTDGSWSAGADLVDGTETGGDTTLAQTGTIHFNKPTDQVRTRIGDTDLNDPKFAQMYWLKLKFSGALTATTAGNFKISTYEDVYKVDYSNNAVFESDATAKAKSATGSEFWNTITYTTAEDTIYIGCQNGYFRGARFILGTQKNEVAASTATAKYYNGAWVDLLTAHNFADGTSDGAITFAQSGDMTWDQITDGLPTTINSTTAYWIAITVDKSMTANIAFEAAMLINRNCPIEIMYRADESTHFTEGQSSAWPSQITSDESYNPATTTLLIGGKFDSTNEQIIGGYNPGCAIESIKVHLERGSTAAKRCIDGSGAKYAKEPGYSAKPAGTITVVYRGDTPEWWLMHEHLNQGSLADTEDVSRFCICLNLNIPIPISGYTTNDLYPQNELSYPYCALKSAPMGNQNDLHVCTVTYEIGIDNTNSYRAVYNRGISTDSSGYAQSS